MISPCCNINTTIGEIPRLPPCHENLTQAFPPSHPSQKYHKTAGFPTPSLLADIICERPLTLDWYIGKEERRRKKPFCPTCQMGTMIDLGSNKLFVRFCFVFHYFLCSLLQILFMTQYHDHPSSCHIKHQTSNDKADWNNRPGVAVKFFFLNLLKTKCISHFGPQGPQNAALQQHYSPC